MNRVYCLAEDRETEEVGLRIAVASLLRVCPTAKVVVYRPKPTSEFCRWLGMYSQVKMVPNLPIGAVSWNCKPHSLLPILEGGADEVIWIDSDILVTRDPSYLFDRIAPDVFVGTEEPTSSLNQGWAKRTMGWRLPSGRDSKITLNSSVIRVTKTHTSLLHAWQKLLCEPEYCNAQRLPLAERPLHLMSDQDVLNALLGSAEYGKLSVQYLRIGQDVIHCGGALGYSLGRRLATTFHRVPPFLHAISGKPWYVFHPDYEKRHSKWFTRYRRLLQETSPYVAAARRLRAEIELPCPWLDAGSIPGRVLRLLGAGRPALLGLPLTAIATVAVAARSAVGRS